MNKRQLLYLLILFLYTSCGSKITADLQSLIQEVNNSSDTPSDNIDDSDNDDTDKIKIFAGLIEDSSRHFLGIEVDPLKSIAYLSVGNGDDCLCVIDYSTESQPTLSHCLGKTTIPSTIQSNCRSAKLVDNNEKILLPMYEKRVEVWSFGTTPKTISNWTRQNAQTFSTKKPKRLSTYYNTGSLYEYVLSTHGGLLKTTYNSTDDSFSIINNGTDAFDNSSSKIYQDGAYLEDGFILATTAGTNKNVEIYNSSSSLIKTITLNNTSNYMWSSHVSEDNKTIAIGGNYLALISYDATEINESDKFTLRHEQTLSKNMRHMKMFSLNSVDYLMGSFSDGTIRVFNITNIDSPTLIRNYDIEAFDGEAYDLYVDTTKERVLVAGTKGKFAILNLIELIKTN